MDGGRVESGKKNFFCGSNAFSVQVEKGLFDVQATSDALLTTVKAQSALDLIPYQKVPLKFLPCLNETTDLGQESNH